jgi:hypothetical protein
MAKGSSGTSVFLNVPFDAGYERVFVALIAGLCVLGCKPRSVLEIPSTKDRLHRLLGLLRSCRLSIHDVSRVSGYPPRFNMPFELGLAAAIGLGRWSRHDFFVLERRPYRVQRTLSDLNGYDAHVHGGTPEGAIAVLLDVVGSPRSPDPEHVRAVARALWIAARDFKRRHRSESVFRPAIFRKLVATGTALSEVTLGAAR